MTSTPSSKDRREGEEGREEGEGVSYCSLDPDQDPEPLPCDKDIVMPNTPSATTAPSSQPNTNTETRAPKQRYTRRSLRLANMNARNAVRDNGLAIVGYTSSGVDTHMQISNPNTGTDTENLNENTENASNCSSGTSASNSNSSTGDRRRKAKGKYRKGPRKRAASAVSSSSSASSSLSSSTDSKSIMAKNKEGSVKVTRNINAKIMVKAKDPVEYPHSDVLYVYDVSDWNDKMSFYQKIAYSFGVPSTQKVVYCHFLDCKTMHYERTCQGVYHCPERETFETLQRSDRDTDGLTIDDFAECTVKPCRFRFHTCQQHQRSLKRSGRCTFKLHFYVPQDQDNDKRLLLCIGQHSHALLPEDPHNRNTNGIVGNNASGASTSKQPKKQRRKRDKSNGSDQQRGMKRRRTKEPDGPKNSSHHHTKRKPVINSEFSGSESNSDGENEREDDIERAQGIGFMHLPQHQMPQHRSSSPYGSTLAASPGHYVPILAQSNSQDISPDLQQLLMTLHSQQQQQQLQLQLLQQAQQQSNNASHSHFQQQQLSMQLAAHLSQRQKSHGIVPHPLQMYHNHNNQSYMQQLAYYRSLANQEISPTSPHPSLHHYPRSYRRKRQQQYQYQYQRQTMGEPLQDASNTEHSNTIGDGSSLSLRMNPLGSHIPGSPGLLEHSNHSMTTNILGSNANGNHSISHGYSSNVSNGYNTIGFHSLRQTNADRDISQDGNERQISNRSALFGLGRSDTPHTANHASHSDSGLFNMDANSSKSIASSVNEREDDSGHS